MFMKRLFKILPILAIVVGIGGAWAYQAEENPCSDPSVESYGEPLDMDAAPDAPTNAGIEELGHLQSNFKCNGVSNTCHYVYESPGEGQPKEWISCPGNFERLPN
jgi:hypothetical protein